MNRNRWLIIGAGALTLSLFLTFLVYRLLQARLQPPEQTVQIVVARQKLPLGMRLSEQDVTLASWPKSMPLEGAFTDPKLAVGRGVVVTMLPNEPILDSKLAPKEGGAGLPSVIPDGMRAISVKVNDVIGVAGFVLPGTRVDVIMTGAPKQNDDVASKTILENVQVLAAGQNVEQDANGRPQSVQVVTLLVAPDQAQDLTLAAVGGTIQLALRNPLDSQKTNPAAVQREALFGYAQVAPVPEKPAVKPKAQPKPVTLPAHEIAPPPAPAPDRTQAVNVFSGKEKQTVTFIGKTK